MEKKNKYFFITIDTEGDNQWDLNKGIETENAKFLPRFQELANKYDLYPVWLTNYEMANDDFFVNYMKSKQDKGLCEIGMHLHAWNNPPEYKLKKINKERDYLIEYPIDIMDKKINEITTLITKKFGIKPITHRSGRWTTNEEYFKLLIKYGYRVDCSVTPHISWKNTLGSTGKSGSDYSNSRESINYIYDKLLEVPMTIRKIHDVQFDRIKTIKNLFGEIKRFVFGRYQWLRPDKHLNFSGLKYLINKCNKKNEYLIFMIHSSELMPGGSPNFKNEDDIDKLYEIIEKCFKYAKEKGYIGITIRDYYNKVGGKDE